jgi:hypothetical protein
MLAKGHNEKMFALLLKCKFLQAENFKKGDMTLMYPN